MTLDAFAGDEEQVRPPAGMTGVPDPLLRLIRDRQVAFVDQHRNRNGLVRVVPVALSPRSCRVSGRVGLCTHCRGAVRVRPLPQVRVPGNRSCVARSGPIRAGQPLRSGRQSRRAAAAGGDVRGWPVLPSQLVVAGLTVVYGWFAHRGFSLRLSPAESGLAEQQQTSP
jgi:hypothetical protein